MCNEVEWQRIFTENAKKIKFKKARIYVHAFSKTVVSKVDDKDIKMELISYLAHQSEYATGDSVEIQRYSRFNKLELHLNFYFSNLLQ